MVPCQRCKCDLTEETSSPSVVKRGYGECNACSAKRMMRYRSRDPKRFILYSSRCNAKVTGVENTLTLVDIPEIPKYCPVFPWIKLTIKTGQGHKNPAAPSIDRIDPSKGYIKGNIRIISWRANQLKSNGTLREFQALVKDEKSRN